ncbi:MAG: hypothetical protein ACOC6B_00850 [Thermodesulfobacteriota bacterium]
MTSSSDVNIILGQSDAIKEVHSVRKQSLEAGQQFIAQQTEDKRKHEKEKVKGFEPEMKIENEEKGRGEEREDANKDGRKKRSDGKSETSEGFLIDITV